MTKSVKLAIASAALAGMVAGTSASLFAQDNSTSTTTDKTSKKATKHTKEKHACKGQNSCKGKGGCATDGSKMPDSQ